MKVFNLSSANGVWYASMKFIFISEGFTHLIIGRIYDLKKIIKHRFNII